ncbi:hypothetical protein N7491_001767 [Penicillium cf. griseofulvum]|uniref:Uncharacterized protein n=1 Tax=Penicillium cf. griseofulvum TaxID=2972120 RepID=A0A9W9JCA3_9EURO|nr:hypothetical protein N7472_006895 [Penicillium cf. griseofulvum]KAJ5445685.1 hypothetical protein N7491_001767 [Penicillium cf. griseofulvum]
MTPEGVEGEAGLHDSSHNTTRTISDCSFFREHRASTLPTPTEVRAVNEESSNIRGTRFNLPPPVRFLSLGLIVKYGADTTVTEAETQNMGKPVPEVFGWINPAYWEYCKARRVRPNPEYFDEDLDEEWNTRYLPTVLDPVDDETVYHPWLWFVLSKGI